jgi:hypothetical protein
MLHDVVVSLQVHILVATPPLARQVVITDAQRSSGSRTVDPRVHHIIGKDWPHTREDTASSAADYCIPYNLVSCTTKVANKDLLHNAIALGLQSHIKILETTSENKQELLLTCLAFL